MPLQPKTDETSTPIIKRQQFWFEILGWLPDDCAYIASICMLATFPLQSLKSGIIVLITF